MELKLKRRRYKSFKISRKEEGDRYSKFKIRFRIFVRILKTILYSYFQI